MTLSSLPEPDALISRVERLLAGGERVILGIAGAPGAGKSTLAEWLVAEFGERAAHLPMDGFHLGDRELTRIGRLDAKGAIDTFDARGYLASLRRVASDRSSTVLVPEFDRRLEQPVAASLAILPQAQLVVSEGNYLLDLADPWPEVRAQFTETWFCDADPTQRRAWLHARHVEYGKTADAATQWIADVDDPNAVRIESRRDAADLVVCLR